MCQMTDFHTFCTVGQRDINSWSARTFIKVSNLLMLLWTDSFSFQSYPPSDKLACILRSCQIGLFHLWFLAEDGSGSKERIWSLSFTGLCDNLQQRAMSRWCLSVQQPLRRVSEKSSHSFSHGACESTPAGKVHCDYMDSFFVCKIRALSFHIQRQPLFSTSVCHFQFQT